MVEIISGDLKKTIMVGDSEVDSMSAYNAKVPFILVEDGYTEKKLRKLDTTLRLKILNFEKVIKKYL